VGGGDTGADCVNVALRQGADSVVQLEILPKPPVLRDQSCPWPNFARLFKSNNEKKLEQRWSVLTKEFLGQGAGVKGLRCEISGTEFEIEADLVILALGFLKPATRPEEKGIFVAGDARRGPSLIVWAIWEGRQAAEAIDHYLKEEK
jgi:glutamate synthase (NADPH/NADH) small chain